MAYKTELTDEEYEAMSDEEFEKLFAERATNSRKSIASTYAYLIIRAETSEAHHMTQAELMKKLAKSPIEIKLDRKAISRMVYTLADAGLGIKASPKEGIWYDGRGWNSQDCA